EGKLTHLVALRGGARVVASWGETSERAQTPEARRVGATAAMLAIPLMREDEAAKLAEAEGIVCHLTSLVLIDDAGERHQGLPAARKVALSNPRTASRGAVLACMAPMDFAPSARKYEIEAALPSPTRGLMRRMPGAGR